MAPKSRVAVTLTSGVASGMTMVAWMPREVRMVGDALGVIAGAGRDDAARASSGVSRAMRLSAPRSLKEPVICRFSSLRKICCPVRAERVFECAQGV